jgi:hypothetical protein
VMLILVGIPGSGGHADNIQQQQQHVLQLPVR